MESVPLPEGHRAEAERVKELTGSLWHRATSPVTEFVRNSPFLCASLGIHVLVLVLLAFITASQPVEIRRRITIRLEDITADQIKLQPLQREDNLAALSAGISTLVGAEGETYNAAASGATRVEVPRINIIGLTSPTGSGSEGEWEGHGDSGLKLVPGRGGEKTVGGAVDQFAVITLNCLARGKTLVALLIDRSPSVLYGDLPTMIARMDHYFDEIKNNLPEGVEEKARWVVVSYGKAPNFECQPSADLDYVKNALRGVTSDRTGVENVGAAVEAVLDRYSGAGYKYFLIAALTDEAGDDVNNGVILERVIKRIRQAGARFYVFGYESTFCARQKYVTIPAIKLAGKDRAEYQAYAQATGQKLEDLVIHGFADGGPECPAPELWWTENWWNWQHWGGSFNGLASGFGMYSLNRMALATDGIYFLLRPESNYDEDKLYAKYKPDICSVFTYQERLNQVPLRRELRETWNEIRYFQLDYALYDAQAVQKVLKKSLEGRDYCIKRAEQLKQLIETTKPVGDNWARWEAHADVTLAELLRYRFMLGQYHEVLRRTWAKINGIIPPKKYIVMRSGSAPQDFVGPEQAKQEYDLALAYIERVIEKHKGTPWEIMGQRMKAGLHPWKCVGLEDAPQYTPPVAYPPTIVP